MLGWIDIDAEATRKALEHLKLFETKGSLDQLGLGVLRDRMADRLHPATSTLMTSAVYFILIPKAFRAVEKFSLGKGKIPSSVLREKLNENEMGQALSLITKAKKAYNGKLIGSGIIGWDKLQSGRGWVVQTPSNNYWNSIRQLGLFSLNLNIEQYLRALGSQELRSGNSGDVLADKENRTLTWDEKIPGIDRIDETRLELTDKEAGYLLERFCDSIKFRNTFISQVLKSKPSDRAEFPFLWDHPESENEKFRQITKQAQALSALIVGANRTFNLFLAKQEGMTDVVNQSKEDWEQWVTPKSKNVNVPSRKHALAADLEGLKLLLLDNSPTVKKGFEFLGKFQELLKSRGTIASVMDKEMYALLRNQEKSAKVTGMEKLGRHIEGDGKNKNLSLGGRFAPDFRWQIAKDIACDLYQIPKIKDKVV